jgi:hypothetical protein
MTVKPKKSSWKFSNWKDQKSSLTSIVVADRYPHHFGKPVQDPQTEWKPGVWIKVKADPDPHRSHGGSLGRRGSADPHQYDEDPDPHQIEKSDPDPHQSDSRIRIHTKVKKTGSAKWSGSATLQPNVLDLTQKKFCKQILYFYQWNHQSEAPY